MPQPSYYFNAKAVSVVQPWADAIAFAGKNIENRSRRTHYRGPIAIHSSQKFWPECLTQPQRVIRGGEKRPLVEWINKGRKKYGLEPEEKPKKGHVVAIAMLVDCIEKSSSPWFDGDFGWVLEGIVPVEPVAMKGDLGIWNCEFEYTTLLHVKR